jgi:hypothetical protein
VNPVDERPAPSLGAVHAAIADVREALQSAISSARASLETDTKDLVHSLYGVKSAMEEKLHARAVDDRQAAQVAERATAFQASFQHLSNEINGASSERQSQMDSIKEAAVSAAQKNPAAAAQAPPTHVWEYVLFGQGAIIIVALAWRTRGSAKHNAKLLGHSD